MHCLRQERPFNPCRTLSNKLEWNERSRLHPGVGIGILPCPLIRYSLWASSGIRIRSLCLSRAPTPLLQYSGLGCPHTNGQNRQCQYQPAILDDFIFVSFRLFFNCTVAFPLKKVTPRCEEKENSRSPFGCLKKSPSMALM